jgi:CubicO group peptidase (beta-lactamase class C family)
MNRVTRRQFLGVAVAAPLAASLHLASTRAVQASTHVKNNGLYDALDANAESIRSTYHVPGVSTVAIEDDKVAHAAGFGVMAIGRHKPMTTQSVHCLASCSKTVTGAAIMQFVDAGRLDINLPVTTCLPDFQLVDPRYSQITIRHLLGHQSGLPGLNLADSASEWYDPWLDDDALRRYVIEHLRDTHVTLSFAPGEGWDYSNVGYSVLGEVIQRLSGELFEDYCANHLFQPLGMSHTTLLKPDVPNGLLTTPHNLDAQSNVAVSPVYPWDRKKAPAGCLYSDVNDMSIWVRMFMYGGEFMGRRVISRESRDILWQPIMDWGGGYGAGSGWFHQPFGSGRMIYCGGATVGCNASFGVIPERMLGAGMIGNYLNAFDEPFYAIDYIGFALGKMIEAGL